MEYDVNDFELQRKSNGYYTFYTKKNIANIDISLLETRPDGYFMVINSDKTFIVPVEYFFADDGVKEFHCVGNKVKFNLRHEVMNKLIERTAFVNVKGAKRCSGYYTLVY